MGGELRAWSRLNVSLRLCSQGAVKSGASCGLAQVAFRFPRSEYFLGPTDTVFFVWQADSSGIAQWSPFPGDLNPGMGMDSRTQPRVRVRA